MVMTGLDVLLKGDLRLLRGRRVGVLCHPASVNRDYIHLVDALVSLGLGPARLFGPEHGVRGEAQDMISVDAPVDPMTQIPVVSLYGTDVASLQPPLDSLRDLDVLLIDLQDVGSRYYTFIWTLGLVLEAAAKVGIQVVVLDRPNPIGGMELEGGGVDSAYESFVGLGSISVRHGLTLGEVARLLAAGLPWEGTHFRQPLDIDLSILAMQGWRRRDYFDETGCPWVMPSPNMPTVDTALVYPGMCLVEGTQISEGRGTTRPFEIIGAPFVDGHALSRHLQGLPGVRFRPLSFRPTFHKFAQTNCGGIQIHVTDRYRFRPLRTGIALLHALRALYGDRFAWRTERYEFVSDRLAIDLLAGSKALREGIDAQIPLAEIFQGLEITEKEFAEFRMPYLLY